MVPNSRTLRLRKSTGPGDAIRRRVKQQGAQDEAELLVAEGDLPDFVANPRFVAVGLEEDRHCRAGCPSRDAPGQPH